jgi:DNA-binding MarR family transcriptional regulator
MRIAFDAYEYRPMLAARLCRNSDPGDARVVRISATKKGHAKLEAACARRLAALENLLLGCSETELRSIDLSVRTLERLVTPLLASYAKDPH